MRQRTAGLLAAVLHQILKGLILLPDRVLAVLMRVAKFVGGLFGLSENWKKSLGEMGIIFSQGGEGAKIVRKMVREGAPRRIRHILRALFL